MKIMAKTGYYLLKATTWFIHLFPLRFHYFVSDIFFLFVYFVARYRRKVVFTNLRNSFPEKTEAEIGLIARKFYRNFCDSLLETLYFDRISPDEIVKRQAALNNEMLVGYLSEGRSVIMTMGHYNNWEWNCAWPLHAEIEAYVVYKRLSNKSFDKFYYTMRSRFGMKPLERADTFRQLISDTARGLRFAAAFLMDQTPRKHEIQYWTTFLNQETAVVTGTEKIARKLDAVVLFCHVKKLRRGYNCVEFTLVTEHAAETKPFEITEKVTRLLEETIRERPELWLWSHKRWKHKRETVE
jgi:KDO2-lipid IV(A) lauroyltransferase